MQGEYTTSDIFAYAGLIVGAAAFFFTGVAVLKKRKRRRTQADLASDIGVLFTGMAIMVGLYFPASEFAYNVTWVAAYGPLVFLVLLAGFLFVWLR